MGASRLEGCHLCLVVPDAHRLEGLTDQQEKLERFVSCAGGHGVADFTVVIQKSGGEGFSGAKQTTPSLNLGDTALTFELCELGDQRTELVRALAEFQSQAPKGLASEQGENTATSEQIEAYLDQNLLKRVDYAICLGAEEPTLPACLIWSGAYAEFLWQKESLQAFSVEQFERCLAVFSSRERRFGGLRVVEGS